MKKNENETAQHSPAYKIYRVEVGTNWTSTNLVPAANERYELWSTDRKPLTGLECSIGTGDHFIVKKEGNHLDSLSGEYVYRLEIDYNEYREQLYLKSPRGGRMIKIREKWETYNKTVQRSLAYKTYRVEVGTNWTSTNLVPTANERYELWSTDQQPLTGLGSSIGTGSRIIIEESRNRLDPVNGEYVCRFAIDHNKYRERLYLKSSRGGRVIKVNVWSP